MNDIDFNLDDILSEFSDTPAPVRETRAPKSVPSARDPRSRAAEELIAEQRSRRISSDDAEPEMRRPQRRSEPVSPFDEESASDRRRVSEDTQRRAQSSPERRRTSPPERRSSSPSERKDRRAPADIMDVRLSPKGRPVQREPEDYSREPERERSKVSPAAKLFGGIVFLGVLLAVSLWLLTNIHPNTTTVKTENARQEANLTSRFENLANNLASDALSDITYIKKVYSIPEDASVAPKPSQACFGESRDPAVIQGIIDGAAELLDGQETVWNPDISTFNNTPVKYYCDDTILSLVWKEVVDNTVFTFAEVKIADGSQLRRSLAGDAYSSSIQLKASDMASTVNAVTAMNGDFYAFRQVGIVVYKRNLERFEPSTLDSCFFTSKGEMIFAHRGELTSEEDTVRFIQDNDVVFSTSFGPILVENGELYKTHDYPIGEIFTKYARSAIGMTGDLHYLLMATSSEKNSGYIAGVYVSKAGEIMYSKGCTMAYELDGGQTAVIIHNNDPANEIVYGSERTMSDIIYFATAIPDGEG